MQHSKAFNGCSARLTGVLTVVQSSMQGMASQIEKAAAADNFEEATALQAELDSSTEEADALAAEYAFTPDDMQDLIAVTAAPTAASTAAPTKQTLHSMPAPAATHKAHPTSEISSNTQQAVPDDASAGRKTDNSQDLSNALSREVAMDYEDGESVDPDEDGMHVGYSSSVISASHAATDGSRSVQSSRTVLDRMPEFNMDDAVSFR